MHYHLKIVSRPDAWRAMLDIRRAVLFAPDRHAIAYDEAHPDDRVYGNTPFLFCENDEPVGVATGCAWRRSEERREGFGSIRYEVDAWILQLQVNAE